MWENLLKKGLLISVAVSGKKGDNFARPFIKAVKDLRQVIAIAIPGRNPTFPELYNLDKLAKYLNGNPSRLVNARIIEQYLEESVKFFNKPRKGKKSNASKVKSEQMEKMLEKFRAGEALAYQFLDKMSAATPGTPGKRRRLAIKTSEPCSQPQPESTLTPAVVSYHYTLDGLLRTRRQADQVAAQSGTRRVLRQVLSHTKDLDIENCMFTIIDQLVDMLQLCLPCGLREVLSKCARMRSMVCREFLHTDTITGKQLLTSVMAGSGLASPWDRNEFLQEVQKLSRFMRWFACSCLPEVYQACCDDPKRTFPESSTFYFMWTAIEDWILSSWLEFTLENAVRHVSLHYDGLRLDADLSNGVADYCVSASEHIFNQTGFRVNIREKLHQTFGELLPTRAVESRVVPDRDEVLDRPGNGIAGAVSHLLSDASGLLEALKSTEDQDNVVAANRQVRTYRQVQAMTGMTFHPILGFEILEAGSYLIHSEGDGCPHCISAKYNGGEDTCVQLYDGNTSWDIELPVLRACSVECIDKSTLITFRVYAPGAVVPQMPDQPFPGAFELILDAQA